MKFFDEDRIAFLEKRLKKIPTIADLQTMKREDLSKFYSFYSENEILEI
jgi:hypothetical protein